MESKTNSVIFEDDYIEDFLPDEFSLYCVEALDLAVVFEDLVDKLDVLGQTIRAPHIELRSKASIIDSQLHRPVFNIGQKENELKEEDTWLLRQHYQTSLPRRIEQKVEKAKGAEIFRRRLSEAIQETGITSYTVAGKTQRDRAYLHDVVQELFLEVIQNSKFASLAESVNTQKQNHQNNIDRIENHVRLTQRFHKTKKDIVRLRQEKISESKAMVRHIWELEDDEQELLFKKDLELAYVTKVGAMMRCRSKKMCRFVERGFEERLEDLKLEVLNEHRAHASMMQALGNKYRELEEKLDYWMEKYETDKEELQTELDQMKEDREKDLVKIAWFKHINGNYWQIIKEERRLVNVIKTRENQELRYQKTATKLQAWWRGTMVRKSLGPFRPAKPKKEKKGKGKKKKK